MLSDDFQSRVSLQTLGALVPGIDVALGRQHEDRVVEDAVDEEPEALLAFAQRELGLAAFGQVAHDLEVAG